MAQASTSLIAALMQPLDNWGARMAAKDQQLQQQAYLTQQAEQETLQEQQAQAQIQAFRSKLAQTDFERPDKERLLMWLGGERKQVEKRIYQEYKGNRTKFLQIEGQQWMADTLNRLSTSEEYQDGVYNKEQIALAKDALKKNEMLVGDVGLADGKPSRYVPALAMLKAYNSGRVKRFTFNGSYKPDDELVKHFGSQYSPNQKPWEEAIVPEEYKINQLLATNDERVAWDKYLQQYKNKAVFYKRDSLLEKTKFEMSLEDQAMQRQANSRQNAMFGLQAEGAKLSNALKRKKLAEDDGSDAFNFAKKLFGNGTTKDFSVAADTEKVLPYSKIDLSGLVNAKGGGVATLLETNLYGGVKALQEKLGLTKTKNGYTSTSIKDGFSAQGLSALDLRNSQFTVTGVDNKLYYKNVNGKMLGFAKVNLAFADDEDAANAGLIEDWSLFDSTKKAGTGVYNKSTKEASIYTPIGDVATDPVFLQQIQKGIMGQKAANDGLSTGIGFGADDE